MVGGYQLRGVGQWTQACSKQVGGFTSYTGSLRMQDDPDYAFGSEKRNGG